jgi:pimeloyl-ACP methyl ester carboxylesterase
MKSGWTRVLKSGAAACILLAVFQGCLLPGQRYRQFTTSTPIKRNDILVLGFQGGRERWNNDRSVRRLALKLRSMKEPGVNVETVENTKRSLALQLIRNALDRNLDGQLDKRERGSARLIIYGHSFGGAAVVKLAHQLKQEGIPVLLTVQVDSVGLGDGVIPSNVARAANFYQNNGHLIRGEPKIRAEDPAATTIVENTRFDYSRKNIDLSGVSWVKKAFRVAHTKMEYDPDVWARVEQLILSEIRDARARKTR